MSIATTGEEGTEPLCERTCAGRGVGCCRSCELMDLQRRAPRFTVSSVRLGAIHCVHRTHMELANDASNEGEISPSW